MSEETAPVRDEDVGGERERDRGTQRQREQRGTGVGLRDAIIPTRMHLFSAMFLLVMLAVVPCEVRTALTFVVNAQRV